MRRSDVLFVAFGVLAGCPQSFEAVETPSPTVDASIDVDDANAPEVDGGGGIPDVAVPETSPPVDANGDRPEIDASGCICDCDKDTFAEGGILICLDGGRAFDCDDFDPRAFPDAGFVTAQPTAETKGDWNCDSLVTRQYNVNVDCPSYPFGTNCASIEGFTSDPGCGETATFVRCKGTALNCATDTTEMRVQGCK